MSTQAETPKRSLVRKMAEVMGEVDRVRKNGRNAFHNYDYATEADIVEAVREGLSKRAVMMLPSIVKTEWTQVQRAKGGTERLCTLTVRFTFHDGDSGEEMAIEVLGEGQDAGDKATYKAFTGATKYALLKTFLIPTGDDPEADEDDTSSRKTKPPVPSGSQRSAPATPAQHGTQDDPMESEVVAIEKASEKAASMDDLQKLRPRADAFSKGSKEYGRISKALTNAYNRINKKVAP
jgi:hypothetical protein